MGDTAHPFDTTLSAGLRFSVEVIAWVAGPWMAFTWSVWALFPVLAILVALPATFSTPGDKNTILVPTPGPIRIFIELLLYAVAAVAPWFVWPGWLAITSGLIVALSIALGFPRFVWLARGAPPAISHSAR